MTTDNQQAEPVDSPTITEQSASIARAEGTPLMDEVQSFLAARDELAKKLAAEIAAMEKKLAELKRTAALLFPANDTPTLKEKKPKKSSTKVGGRTEPSEASPQATTETGPDEAAA